MSQMISFLRSKKEWTIPAVIFTAALIARLYLLFTHRYPMMLHEQDGIGYMAVAEKIRAFQPFFDVIRPPSYPFIISIFSILPIDPELAARIASLFMDALIVVPLYWLGREFLSCCGAFVAALLWSFFPFSLNFSISPLSQSTFLFFLSSGILFFIWGVSERKPRRHFLFAAGMLFALSYLARPEGVVTFGAACAGSLLFVIGKKNRKEELLGGLFLVVGFLLCAGPYLVFLRSRLGYWGLTGKSDLAVKTIDTVLTLDPGGNLPRASRGLEAWSSVYGDMGTFLDAFTTNVQQFATVFYVTFPLWMHILAAIGAVFLVIRRKWLPLFSLFLFVIATLPDFIVNIPKTQSYIYSAFPVLMLLFAGFWDGMAGFLRDPPVSWSWPPRGGVPRQVIAAIVLVPALITSVFFFGWARAALEQPRLLQEALLTERVYLESGRIIRDISHKNDKIMTRWGLIGYFADRDVVTLPKGGVQEVVDYGRKNGVKYLVIDTTSVLSRRPELMELLEPLAGREVKKGYGIEPLYRNYYQVLGGYVIYRYSR